MILKGVQIPNHSIQDPWATAQAVLKYDCGQLASVLAQSGHRVKGTVSSGHDVRLHGLASTPQAYDCIVIRETKGR